jgi:transposase-like protein
MNIKPSAYKSSAIARRCAVKQAWNMDAPKIQVKGSGSTKVRVIARVNNTT